MKSKKIGQMRMNRMMKSMVKMLGPMTVMKRMMSPLKRRPGPDPCFSWHNVQRAQVPRLGLRSRTAGAGLQGVIQSFYPNRFLQLYMGCPACSLL